MKEKNFLKKISNAFFFPFVIKKINKYWWNVIPKFLYSIFILVGLVFIVIEQEFLYLLYLYIIALVLQFFYYSTVDSFLSSGQENYGGISDKKTEYLNLNIKKSLKNINEFIQQDGKYRVKERYAEDGSIKEKSFFDKKKNSYEGKIVYHKDKINNLYKETLYDDKNNLIGNVENKYYNDGSKKQRNYDQDGKLISLIEYDSNRTYHKETQYDSNGKFTNTVIKDLQTNNLIETINYKNNQKDQKLIYDKDGKIIEKHLYYNDKKVKEEKFNSDHQVISEGLFDKDGEVTSLRKMTYNGDGKVQQEEFYDKEQLLEIQKNEYNENGLLTDKKFLNQDNEVKYKSSYMYDNNGKLYQKTDTDSLDQVQKITIYQYENDHIQSKVEKDSNNEVVSIINYKYNNSDKVLEIETNYPTKKIKNITNFDGRGNKHSSKDYDKNNNLILERKYLNNQEIETITKRYEGNKCIEEMSYNEDQILKSKKVFDSNEKLGYHEFFDDNGDFLGENHYNENQQIIKGIHIENETKVTNEYIYNDFGFLKQKLKYDDQNRLLTRTVYQYDSKGKVIKQDVFHQ